MDEDYRAFGRFIETRRKELGLTAKKLADTMGVGTPYMSDIENGRRYPPEKHFDTLAEILQLDEAGRLRMIDLAACARENQLAPDIVGYVRKTDLARVALRKARKRGVPNDVWERVIEMLDEQYPDQGGEGGGV
ncbi:hypothetical protein BK816_07280 [Boudabousia tangfeifanii]|uniref:HTH cro/C1-type domain-containing protein n=1 Tax=Boudabousia tangfeifanii TaxID=1912795 RepID=A0A1D9MLE1_9ACTO|nr:MULTISPECIES: helix-turn-helix transcriptional regulator [Boudabousia]AOZ73117.1 hypothetical protein BK816_07280 [Boudabousia tangfeifanii]OKL46976.1 hypothetical protein BSR28_06035 [Boudabousia liubingyangii]